MFNNKNQFHFFAFLFFASVIFSCKKDKPIYSNVPEISSVSVNPTTVREYKDSIAFKLSYVDGNGDLGENDPNVTNLFLTDNRVNITYGFRISQLAPDNANIVIKGQLLVVLKNTGITDNSSSQTVTYSLYLKDRSGNQSNTISTESIMVEK